MSNLSITYYKALEKLWTYIASTINLGIEYTLEPTNVVGYVDADLGGDLATRRLTTD